MGSRTVFHLAPAFFGESEKTLLEHGGMTVSGFRFSTGVCGLRVTSSEGELVVLPYQGQQIWSANFRGRELTMQSMFAEPQPTQEYLDTYGGFLLHCGATAMGVPMGEDTHALHGELPNAAYQKAYLVSGEDEKGAFVGVGGCYQHTVAFNHNYTAEPLVTVRQGSPLFDVDMALTNLKNTDMEWMYLAHINFRPVDGGKLVYSAPCTPASARVRKSVPAHVKTKPGYREFLAELEEHPEKHNVLTDDQMFDPEVVFFLDYLADDVGWAHTMQVHPDGTGDYVGHRPEQLGVGVRWICRTEDQAAMGMILPATAEPEGYHAEKEKGNIKILPAKQTVVLNMTMGVLDAQDVDRMSATVDGLLQG
ncbi:MAG: DUF4432 family protein [Lentisphaerae bacterium]|jgi:hypothetical protein|nr:DUF4432 family protein [Lentisphaerota bacterium]MBT4815398.1 DUF4432 family protein [Lentisphaerota bacterium]MBT5611268.1 DUF4432 family protein [Lentisphaerota bacterium]MBT7058415.1 DUF4432 family protein [Lentisphaerota bacterium]MBT7846850.1 DUF4432 family protein [Lentisphaerota bacterium]